MKDNICPECGKEFANKNGVGVHLTAKHDKPSNIEVSCENCGESKDIPRAKAQRSDNHFCNKKCYGEWVTGENHPKWNRETVSCFYCGTEKQVTQKKILNHDKYFCDAECLGHWQSENLYGKDHPAWKQNATLALDYGEMWPKRRKEFIQKTSDECMRCEVSEDDIDRELHVHHIIRPEEFDDIEKSHEYENLMRLCHKCHPTVENMNEDKQKEIKNHD